MFPYQTSTSPHFGCSVLITVGCSMMEMSNKNDLQPPTRPIWETQHFPWLLCLFMVLKWWNAAKWPSQTAHNSLPHLALSLLLCTIVGVKAELQHQLLEQKTRRSVSGAVGTRLHRSTSTIVSATRCQCPSAPLKAGHSGDEWMRWWREGRGQVHAQVHSLTLWEDVRHFHGLLREEEKTASERLHCYKKLLVSWRYLPCYHPHIDFSSSLLPLQWRLMSCSYRPLKLHADTVYQVFF